VTIPPNLLSLGLKLASGLKAAWEFCRTRVWVGWTAAALMVLPLRCSQQDYAQAHMELMACREAAHVILPEVKEKASARTGIKVKLRPVAQPVSPSSMAFAGQPVAAIPDAQAGFVPGVEVVIEADAASDATLTQPAPQEAPKNPVTLSQNGLSLGLGYFLTPMGVVAVQAGKMNLSAMVGPWAGSVAYGGTATYQVWGW
jgi:hypothetical protein